MMIVTIAKQDHQVEWVSHPMTIELALHEDKPDFITYDTETSGLHIKKDRPFWGAVCWDKRVFIFDTNELFLKALVRWSKLIRKLYGHNMKFDMHMTANVIGDEAVLSVTNWADTMGLCRLSFEAISARDGGDSLQLKRIGKKYVDPESDRYEKQVKEWLKNRQGELNRILTALLKPVGWSYTKYNKAIKDGEEVPPEVQEIATNWKLQFPAPTYKDVPQEIMIPYLATDVILTKEMVLKGERTVKKRELWKIAEKEFALLSVVFKMERVGFKVDRDYLNECLVKIDKELEIIRERAYEIAGQKFKSGQHQFIKKLYESITDAQIESTDKKFLKGMSKDGDELAPLIIKWRSLEKWRETYIIRILEASEYDGRLYTTLGQFNPVSGRFSGDAQQFPKKALYTEEGDRIIKTGAKPGIEHEIFHPRRAFTVSGGGYSSIYYLDFSQVELRVQAHYTLPFGGDTNLCRAYMPFECVHHETGELYDYKTLEGRKRWGELRAGYPTDVHWEDQLKQGWSVWVVPETGNPWKPTDVHAQTTTKALGILGYDVEAMSPDDFAQWRGIGKGFNFMRNYGGGAQKASDTLGITLEEATAMVNGYTEAFPKVIDYQNYVVRAMEAKGFVYNLYGRRYYIKNSRRFYKCGNYLIQGTCADDLKNKMLQIDQFLTENNCKSRIVMCIHDEIQYEVWDGEEWIIPKIKAIMEYTPLVQVPIVSDVEKTTGTWADKKKVLNIA